MGMIANRKEWCMAVMITTLMTASTFSGAQTTSANRGPASPISLTLKPVKSMVKSGQDVLLVVTLRNKTDHLTPVYREQSDDQVGWVYRVEIQGRSGGKPPETEYARDIAAGTLRAGGVTALGAGKTIVDTINVSKLFDLSHPDKYTIEVKRVDPASKSDVVSNRIVISVVP